MILVLRLGRSQARSSGRNLAFPRRRCSALTMVDNSSNCGGDSTFMIHFPSPGPDRRWPGHPNIGQGFEAPVVGAPRAHCESLDAGPGPTTRTSAARAAPGPSETWRPAPGPRLGDSRDTGPGPRSTTARRHCHLSTCAVGEGG